jgi:MFS transporter, FHS family, L-fucose permease
MAITNAAGSSVSSPEVTKTDKSAMAMVTTLFFVWGFLTCLNDILIPHLRSIFSLSYAQVMLVQFVFFSGYAVFAVPAGKLVDWIGYKRTMVLGLLVMAVGALLFLPAASVPAYSIFLSALIVVAIGITSLQVSANPYVSILGPPATASSRLNLTQAFNSLGTFVAPYFGSLLILSTSPKTVAELARLTPNELQAYRLHEAASVKTPYLLIAVALVVLALVIAFFKLPAIKAQAADTADEHDTSFARLWKEKHLVLGVVGIFVYVGAEVAIGSFLVNYFSQPEIGAMSEKTAAVYVSFYWGLAMIGRFIGSILLQKAPTGKTLGIAALIALLLVVTSILTLGHFAMWTIIVVGLFNSIMFPSIFTLGIANLGHLTSKGSGLLIAAIVGGAIIPVIEGAIADQIGIHHAFFLPALCYVFIAYYGFRGSRPAADLVSR